MINKLPPGIMLQKDYGDMKVYRIACSCDTPDHDITLMVEADDLFVTVRMYSTLTTNFWSISRWKHIFKILFTGKTEIECTTLLSQTQSESLSQLLHIASEDVKRFREKIKR